VLDPKFFGSATYRRRVAAADNGDLDTAAHQQLYTGAILYVKKFQFVTAVAVDNLAIGEHPIDVEDDAAYFCC
jgi:hypothetical protein